MTSLSYKSYADLAKAIHDYLPLIADQGFDLIVGIPRSGMVPAHIIGQDMNISVCSFDELVNNSETTHGNRVIRSKTPKTTHVAKKILVVDDAYGGGQRFMAKVASLPQKLRKKVTTLAVYSSTDSPTVDIYFEVVPYPRVFEWNILHHDIYTGQACYDMDGVLCEDPTVDQNDDGKEYLNFIKSARPKYIPTYTIKTIVTSRLEKYRKPTEAWLKKHGVKYQKLIMLDGYTAEERVRLGIHGRFKAQEYAKENYSLFVESNYSQALEINQLTGKPVYCIDSNILINDPKVEPQPKPDKIAQLKTVANNNLLLRTFTRLPYKAL
ncbi:WbsZ [Candidatus Saccharibacteria bacterium RAAC3_TM7_1]|nr:WbsZ [Candidatus Saccharibacteria bacterium RAAC3_TM7_1]